MNLLELPKVNVMDTRQLPAIPGVYFVLNQQGAPLYIGASVNIKKRWFFDRHQHIDLAKKENASIAWIGFDIEILAEREKYYIQELNPPLNKKSGKPPGFQNGVERAKRMVLLNDEEVEMAKNLGGGNISRGVRNALEFLRTTA